MTATTLASPAAPAGSAAPPPTGPTLAATPLSGAVQYACLRVPPHLRGKHWRRLLSHHRPELPDRLVSHNSPMKALLAKFEDPAFVHTYIVSPPGSSPACTTAAVPAAFPDPPPSTALLFELPRYGLEFEVQGGRLVSRNYTGYSLSRRQQLVAGMDAGEPSAVAAAAACGVGTALASSAGSGPHCLLTDFQQYLVLQPTAGNAAGSTAGRCALDLGECMVLVPVGTVALAVDGNKSGGLVSIVVPPGSGAEMKATSVPSRLQLAALHAATSSLLPEPLSRLTGAQTAMALVRQCWGNHPLSPSDQAQLRSVARLGGHLAPALHPLCDEAELSASQLHHLYSGGAAPHCDGTSREEYANLLSDQGMDAGTAYLQQQRQQQHACHGFSDCRMALTSHEEDRALGVGVATAPAPVWLTQTQYSAINDVPACLVPASFIAATERMLMELVVGRGTGRVAAEATEQQGPAYPLSISPLAAVRSLEHEMHAELRASWEAHHLLPVAEAVVAGAASRIAETQAVARQAREWAEAYLLQHINAVPLSVGCRGTSFRLLRLADAVPTCSLLDLARLALHPELLHEFNPFLSPSSRGRVMEGVVVWLQLCVLEDRLGRLRRLTAGGPERLHATLQELRVHRTWDVAEHLEWLVFEVEGRLQIRPQQHWVAHHLMNHPGAIDQLNMGEGKTRVILPMLALHWAKKGGGTLVRLNFLPTLIDEAYAHLHNTLCASVLGRKLFRMPFHRDVDLTLERVLCMHACLTYCQQAGGLLLVAPEDRLSLHLKGHELGAKQDIGVCTALDALASLPFLDVLDESDELLHHRFQLIYACGAMVPLSARQERAHALQALLRIVGSSPAAASVVSLTLSLPRVAIKTEQSRSADGSCSRPFGAFSGLRLLPGDALEAALPGLHLQLAQELVADPPHAMRWLRDHPHQGLIVQCVTDASCSVQELLLGTAAAPLLEDQLSAVLALRGLLAYGVLQHCLQKRHNVEYGVFRSPAARKRLAVPFRAAHTPSERSEYAQPDVALVLTTLAYYHDGLSHAELLSALSTLLGMKSNAQSAYYNEWLRLSNDAIPAEHRESVDRVSKLDTSNAQQMDLMWGWFSHNMAAVDFWLNFCVLPGETQQFPQRLATSAWHLAHNASGAVVGFSGTNDNHRLLPLSVKQQSVDEPLLLGTNGKMLAVILDNPTYTTLAVDVGTPVWQCLLNLAARERLDALLDCGALLAGVDNSAAAQYLLPLLDIVRFKGVCFFDTHTREWTIIDTQHRRLPRHSSPVSEREAFVLFDDARCRGADLQLRPDAVGLLTLGPKTCKDKLMQAAGRLRLLGRGQTLRSTGTCDVTAKILSHTAMLLCPAPPAASPSPANTPRAGTKRKSSPPSTPTLTSAAGPDSAASASRPARSPADAATAGTPPSAATPALPDALTSRHVLQWVMHNTVQATQSGVVEWGLQGLHFASTHGGTPGRALVDEQLQLAALYSAARVPQGVGEVLCNAAQAHMARCGAHAPPNVALLRLVGSIQLAGALHGRGHSVLSAATGADEECERELEKEQEQEQQVEPGVAKVEAADEVDWAYAAVLTAATPLALATAGGCEVLTLHKAAERLRPPHLWDVLWSPQVYCTSNFLCAIKEPADSLNEYLRPVDALLVFAEGDVLLVSEREADALLRLAWTPPLVGAAGVATRPATSPPPPILVSLCYARALNGKGQSADAAAVEVVPPLAVAMVLPILSAHTGQRPAPEAVCDAASQQVVLVSAQVFNGEATYCVDGLRRWEELRSLPQVAELRRLVAGRRGAAELLAGMRGRQNQFPHSHLELACTDRVS